MRSFAMLCVIITHSGYGSLFGTRYGIVAVESFFVVSGFLIGGILLRDFKDEMNFNNVTLFWKKRWFRTLPLYYVVLLLKFIFIDHSIGVNILYYFTFLQSNFYGIDYLTVSWTLVVEEWFYLLMPLFFVIFFRKGIQPKKFYILLATFIIADNILRYIWVLKTNYPYGAMVGNFVFRMDSNLIGVGLAGIKMFHPEVFKKMADIRYFIFGVIALIATFFLFTLHGGGTNDVNIQAIWVRSFWFSLVSLFFAMMIPFFYLSPVFAPKEGTQPFRWLITWISLLSYPIYLVHVEIYHYLNRVYPYFLEMNAVLRFIIQNSIVIVIALLLYHFIDKPVLNYRAKLSKKTK